ncbi:MAG: DUF881 domain-containing protein [Corynebacteriales bacterium]|nr:DUF881 domain-containing protein [Mycobacteriales bacterium]
MSESNESEAAHTKRRNAIAGALTALMVGISGFALAAQLSRDEDKEFSAAREPDLVQILDSLDARRERIRAEIEDLQERQRALDSDTQGSEAALEEAEKRAGDLAILAGTVGAKGPGLSIVIESDTKHPTPELLVDTVAELRGAGAEAMQISDNNGASARIVTSTYFAAVGEGLDVDGITLSGPYTLTVIGDPPTMQAALSIPGGIVDTVRRGGSKISIDAHDEVNVSATRPPTHPSHAQPTD